MNEIIKSTLFFLLILSSVAHSAWEDKELFKCTTNFYYDDQQFAGQTINSFVLYKYTDNSTGQTDSGYQSLHQIQYAHWGANAAYRLRESIPPQLVEGPNLTAVLAQEETKTLITKAQISNVALIKKLQVLRTYDGKSKKQAIFAIFLDANNAVLGATISIYSERLSNKVILSERCL